MTQPERTCEQCGIPKPADAFGSYVRNGRVTGLRLRCRECACKNRRDERKREAALREPQNGRPRIPEPREWSLTKRCARCDETKPWALFSPARYWADGSVRIVQPRCKACQASLRRGHHRKASPADIIRKADWDKRRRAEMRAERGSQSGRRLPLEPFREWLTLAVRDYGDIESVSRVTGIDPRTLSRATDGTHAHVLERVVDQCFIRTGYHPNDFYSEDQEMAA